MLFVCVAASRESCRSIVYSGRRTLLFRHNRSLDKVCKPTRQKDETREESSGMLRERSRLYTTPQPTNCRAAMMVLFIAGTYIRVRTCGIEDRFLFFSSSLFFSFTHSIIWILVPHPRGVSWIINQPTESFFSRWTVIRRVYNRQSYVYFLVCEPPGRLSWPLHRRLSLKVTGRGDGNSSSASLIFCMVSSRVK